MSGRPPKPRACASKCNVIVRETLSELRGPAQLMQHVGARESVAHLDKLAIALVMLSIAACASSPISLRRRNAALDILVSRLQNDLKNFQAMRSKND
jgi:hypothetical protein